MTVLAQTPGEPGQWWHEDPRRTAGRRAGADGAPRRRRAADRQASLSYSVSGSEQVTLSSQEDRVTVVAHDAVSAVARLVLDVSSPDGTSRQVVGCGRASAAALPGSTVTISTTSGLCDDGRVAAATYGSLEVTFHRRPRPKAVRHVVTNGYALLIGIQDYAGRTEDTVGGLGDAAAVRSALLHSGWQDDHILVLTDAEASADGIRNGLAWLVARSTPSTFSLLHYSGHICIASRGPCGSGHTWLWTQDNRFLSEDEVASRLSGLQGNAWLDVAGCESGAFDVGFSGPTHLFSSSSRGSETSYEDPKHSESVYVQLAWSQAYRQGLGDPAGTTYHATMRQMAAYAAQRAPGYTSRGERGPQHPVFAGGDPSWRLDAPPSG